MLQFPSPPMMNTHNIILIRLKARQECQLSPVLLNIILELQLCNKRRQKEVIFSERLSEKIGKEKKNLLQDEMIVYIEQPREFTFKSYYN